MGQSFFKDLKEKNFDVNPIFSENLDSKKVLESQNSFDSDKSFNKAAKKLKKESSFNSIKNNENKYNIVSKNGDVLINSDLETDAFILEHSDSNLELNDADKMILFYTFNLIKNDLNQLGVIAFMK